MKSPDMGEGAARQHKIFHTSVSGWDAPSAWRAPLCGQRWGPHVADSPVSALSPSRPAANDVISIHLNRWGFCLSALQSEFLPFSWWESVNPFFVFWLALQISAELPCLSHAAFRRWRKDAGSSRRGGRAVRLGRAHVPSANSHCSSVAGFACYPYVFRRRCCHGDVASAADGRHRGALLTHRQTGRAKNGAPLSEYWSYLIMSLRRMEGGGSDLRF